MSTFTIPMVGANAVRRTTYPDFFLGVTQLDNLNRTQVYVQADVAVAAGVTVATMSGAFHLTSATGGGYTPADGVGFAAGEYGWVFKSASPL